MGQPGWRSWVPGGPHGVGRGTRIPLVYLRPGTGSWSLLPVRPGQGAGSGGEKLGGGAELCLAIYSLVSAGGGVGHQTVPPPMHT